MHARIDAGDKRALPGQAMDLPVTKGNEADEECCAKQASKVNATGPRGRRGVS